jgi:hypothetical protein
MSSLFSWRFGGVKDVIAVLPATLAHNGGVWSTGSYLGPESA